jgi:hypothetical protein
MRLVTYRDRDRTIKPGVLLGEEIIDISDQAADVRSLIEEGPDALGKLRNFLKGKTRRGSRLHTPGDFCLGQTRPGGSQAPRPRPSAGR